MAKLPTFSAERSLPLGHHFPPRGAGHAVSSTLVAQQLTFDPNTISFTYCLPCWWNRRRCCGYTHGGDLRCWSDRC
jgi:hypothetical protein